MARWLAPQLGPDDSRVRRAFSLLADFLRGMDMTDDALSVNMNERASAPTVAVNSATLYVRDNGSGKTQLVAKFPTGAVQVIATEP